MSQPNDKEISTYFDFHAPDYHRQYQRGNLESHATYPANYFRLQIIANRMAQSNVRRIYEIGVGEGTPLATLGRMGYEVAGCDVSDAMVARAKERMGEAGLSPDAVQWADVQDSLTFANQLRSGPFDAVIALGVMPHVANDKLFLDNVRMLLRKGGKAFIEFRNKLFSMFTLNRYTKEFILDDLLAGVADDVKASVAAELDRRLAVDQPPPRMVLPNGTPGADAILAKFHNPLTLQDEFANAGFTGFRIHWYHFHPAQPMLERTLGARFREEAMQLEHDATGWRGLFLCSAGLVEVEKAGE